MAIVLLVGFVVLVAVSVLSVFVEVVGAEMVAVVVLVGLVVMVVVVLSAAAVKFRRKLSVVIAAAFLSSAVFGWAVAAFSRSCGFSVSLAAASVKDRWCKRKCCGRSSTRAARLCSGVDGKKCFGFAAAANVVGSIDGLLVVLLELSW